MIGALFTTTIGAAYWVGQQRFQAEQSAQTRKIDESLAAESDVVGLVGRQLSAYTIFVGAFENGDNQSQLKQRRIEANAIQQDWDRSIHAVELELHRYFPNTCMSMPVRCSPERSVTTAAPSTEEALG
jgi:hypothetical protein